ncbi:MAG: DUF2807 domain-containing protein [Tannerellaceae bacterium]|jgi:hypothetical protein|nr:DUF2807 domain-containing protein [Tannerellaceae bacterium]
MKKRAFLFSMGLLLLTDSFTFLHAEKIRGNENIITKEIQVSNFKSIVVGPGVECSSRFFNFKKNAYQSPVLNYTQTKETTALSVTMDENLFSYVEIISDENELSIRTRRGIAINPSRLEINASSKELKQVTVSGCIDFVTANSFKSDQLAIDISGASNVKLNHSAQIELFDIRISGAGDLLAEELVCKKLEINISGAGDIKIKGKADRANFTVSGAGDINAYDFIVEDLECKVSGSGDAKIMATETLNASVSGIGDIRYKGNAKANTRVSGFGGIKKVDN